MPLNEITDLVPSGFSNETQTLIKEKLDREIQIWETRDDPVEGELKVKRPCSLRMAMQLEPLPSYLSAGQIEQDADDDALDASVLPDISGNAVLYSPECQFMLESKFNGMSQYTVYSKGKHAALVLTIVLLGQIFLTIKQIEYCATQSVSIFNYLTFN